MVYREIRKFEIGEHRIGESARSTGECVALGSKEVLGGRKERSVECRMRNEEWDGNCD